MSENERICKELVEQCKNEAKRLVEFTATQKKVHWTHSSFVSFCVSVENILSYGVKKKYQANKSKVITPSGKVLQEVGKTLPDAADIYDKCFVETSAGKEEYMLVHGLSPAERKMGWIRAALVEGKLQAIVQSIMKSPKQFYNANSVILHPVYGEIFQYLIDGPCSIRYSRLKVVDVSMTTPSPAEIVERHNQVLSISTAHSSQSEDKEGGIATEAAWDHVRSLYQSNASTCLFGKNNIMVQPAGFAKPLQGYLTLQQNGPGCSLMLKWIPNTLLQDSTSAHSHLWKTIMSVDIVHQIAHIHCHRSPGRSAEMILIGYDGIAHPPLFFPHVPSFFLFLECIENTLLPKGCLEPPLWYIKDRTTKSSKVKGSPTKQLGEGGQEMEGEWFETMDVWNQVFRIRYSSRGKEISPAKVETEDRTTHAKPFSSGLHFPLSLNLTHHRSGSSSDSSDSCDESESEDSDHSPMRVTVEKPGSLARRDWEEFQSKVSRQVLARYFYSWLSHCRHMNKIQASIAHLVGSTSLSPTNHTQKTGSVEIEEWERFTKSAPPERERRWAELVGGIYFKGVQHELRKEIWPYLLGLYPVKSTKEEREAILKKSTEEYKQALEEWQKVELTKKEIEKEVVLTNGHRSDSVGDLGSPSLSTISGTPPSSPERSRNGTPEPSHSSPSRTQDKLPKENGLGSTSERENGRLHDVPAVTINGMIAGDEELLEDDKEFYRESSSSLSCGKETLDSSSSTYESHDRSHDSSLNQPSDKSNSRDVDSYLLYPHDPEEVVMSSLKLDSRAKVFVKELYNIDKDIPRCDRDYWYFESQTNLTKVRNIICSFVWTHLSEGYSQGMCDLLSPLLVVLDNEPLAYACYLHLMEPAIKLFPPNTAMNTRLANVQALLQVMEPDFHQYLSERPMGDGLFYAYRWLLVTFKREISYDDMFRLWETVWAARISKVTGNFEEFFALAIMKQFKTAIMDAHLDPSDILNLFTDLAEKKAIDGELTIKIAQETIEALHSDLNRKDS